MDEFQLTGLDEVLKKLNAVKTDVKMKGARFAGRKAANLIQKAAVRNAAKVNDPATAEEIAKNVSVRFSSREFRRTGDVKFRIGVLGGARKYTYVKRAGKTYVASVKGPSSNPGLDTWYWRFLEFGTSRQAATPFMRPALEENVGSATDEFTRQLNGWLDRYFRKSGVSTDL